MNKLNSNKAAPPGALKRRKPAVRSAANTDKILRAAIADAIRHGLEGVTARQVSHDAKLTTGAIYSRYENMAELLIAMWSSSIGETLRAHLEATVKFMKSSPNTPPSAKLVADLEKPSDHLKLGAEFLIVARRHVELSEVVVPQVTQWFMDWGLNRESTPIEAASVAVALSSALGTSFRSFISPRNENWGLILAALRNASVHTPKMTGLTDQLEVDDVAARTDNQIVNQLIDATAAVMSRSGFQSATVSRIARKSDITTGSIYNIYEDKETLMNDSVRELLKISSRVNTTTKEVAKQRHRPDFGLTDSFRIGLLPNRQNWLFFRLECVIAARHHRTTRNEIARINNETVKNLAATFPRLPPDVISLLAVAENAIGLGFNSLLPYSESLEYCDFYSVMTAMAQQNGL